MKQEDCTPRELQKQLLPGYQRWGLCIIPLRYKEKIPTLSSWDKYQQEKPQAGELLEWFSNDILKT